MASQVGICNMALSHLGQSKPISSITERSAAARACNRFYDTALEEVLRDFAWPFAKATVPAQQMGISTVRLLDDMFKRSALAVAEHRGTSSAHSSEVPAGILPPMPMPPCPTDGSAAPAGCLAGP